MESLKNNSKSKKKLYISLAFEQAKINLGSTKLNPSVGCIIERNGAVLSSGRTSLNGRPHAEFNALNKNRNFKNANLYVTLEPCSHYGVTPPCTQIILKKKIKKIFYSIKDPNPKLKKNFAKFFKKKGIVVNNSIGKKIGLAFYKSYYLQYSTNLPLIDAKLAISKDFLTKNLKNKWITNIYSRKRVHYIRSTYNCIISTSKSINDDNSRLNCRIDGLENKNPDIVILDRNLKLKKNLRIFDNTIKRKIILITTSKNKKKILYFKKKGIKIIFMKSLTNKRDFQILFLNLKKLGYTRILIESGLTLLNFFIRNMFVNNIYVFKSSGRVFRSHDSIEPGDIVYVPERVIISFNWLQFLTSITQIVSNAVTSIALIRSIQ